MQAAGGAAGSAAGSGAKGSFLQGIMELLEGSKQKSLMNGDPNLGVDEGADVGGGDAGGLGDRLKGLVKSKAQGAFDQALSPQAGPAMAGVPQIDFDQMMAMSSPTQAQGIPADLLTLLRQRGMVL